MLITGDSGKQHGYTDEWTDDGLFAYTGEGQLGDMTLTTGNRAIRAGSAFQTTVKILQQRKCDTKGGHNDAHKYSKCECSYERIARSSMRRL